MHINMAETPGIDILMTSVFDICGIKTHGLLQNIPKGKVFTFNPHYFTLFSMKSDVLEAFLANHSSPMVDMGGLLVNL